MIKIYNYTLTEQVGKQTLKLPMDAEVLAFTLQNDNIDRQRLVFHAEVETDELRSEERAFWVVFTGHEAPNEPSIYRATLQLQNGNVIHVYEERP